MSKDLILISAQPLTVPVNWAIIGDGTKQEIEKAIAAEALLSRVTNAETNDRAQKARSNIKRLKSQLEKERKILKEPLLELGRTLDRNVTMEVEKLDHEDGRLENIQKDFLREEERRIAEERRKQQEELDRIERERQAELQRIEREKLEAERKAREATEAAERAAREASNKKQREEAERLRKEAEAKQAEASRQAEIAKQQMQLVNENADLTSRAESAPISVTRANGQINRKHWKIKSINDFQLMKARPDLVRKIEWDKISITEALNSGLKLPGVEAEEDFSIGARAGRSPSLIEV